MRCLKALLEGLSWSMPVQAYTNIPEVENNLINPKFETEVLQVIRKHPEIVKEALQAYQQQQQKQQQVRLLECCVATPSVQ
ncbi:MAG: hypothetical protein V7K21_26015 [Nostoc sp.]|uniref:hypothetical protein n=1 Tax=Nostoc sp. TaxID=1180 RepID=UPI002FF8FF34